MKLIIKDVHIISHASKVMLKIFQVRLQQYANRELLDVQAGFRKGRGTRDQIANICHKELDTTERLNWTELNRFQMIISEVFTVDLVYIGHQVGDVLIITWL